MLNLYIDLRKCEKGDILVLKDGSLAEYVEHREGEYFPHIIKHLNKNMEKVQEMMMALCSRTIDVKKI